MAFNLFDSFGRRIDYLRLSVIEQCNFKCFYCMPDGSKSCVGRSELLTVAEIARIVGAFAALGVSKVRLTGGEPLLRRDIVDIASAVSSTAGVEDVSLSTNGYLLAKHADALYSAGVQRINVSLDSLNPACFTTITQGSRLAPVLAGIEKSAQVGIRPIKLNMVVMRGVNDGEIINMIEYAKQHDLSLRFIETMPLGSAGLQNMQHHLPAAEIMERVKIHYGADLIPAAMGKGAGPARYYRLGNSKASIGVISAVSRHFCEECNRVRLSARGDLHLCLGDDRVVPLRPYLKDSSDESLVAAICNAVQNKPYSHQFCATSGAHGKVDMSRIGG
jgi:cyclic pyranopterin phosphate synthase